MYINSYLKRSRKSLMLMNALVGVFLQLLENWEG